MRSKKFIFSFLFILFLFLGGCGNVEAENNVKFKKYELNIELLKVDVSIYDLAKPLIFYFPVVTNKEITSTECGWVGAKLFTNKEIGKVTLCEQEQDELNYLYNGRYISFLKYNVEIVRKTNLQVGDSIELCDTKLWIYHDLEFESVLFNDDYLKINIVKSVSDERLPNWKGILSEIKTQICDNL